MIRKKRVRVARPTRHWDALHLCRGDDPVSREVAALAVRYRLRASLPEGYRDEAERWGRLRSIWRDPLAWRKVASASPESEAAFHPVERLIHLVRDASDEEFRRRIWTLLDRDSFVRFVALHNLVGSVHSDDKHNWRLYLNPIDGRFRAIPWDLGHLFASTPLDHPSSRLHERIYRLDPETRAYGFVLADAGSDTRGLALRVASSVTGEERTITAIPAPAPIGIPRGEFRPSEEALLIERRFAAGTHRVESDVILAEHESLVVEPGAVLVLGPGVSIVTRRPYRIEGSASAPVVIRGGSDREPWGVLACQECGPEPSRIRHARISGGREASPGLVHYSGMLAVHRGSLPIEDPAIFDGRGEGRGRGLAASGEHDRGHGQGPLGTDARRLAHRGVSDVGRALSEEPQVRRPQPGTAGADGHRGLRRTPRRRDPRPAGAARLLGSLAGRARGRGPGESDGGGRGEPARGARGLGRPALAGRPPASLSAPRGL